MTVCFFGHRDAPETLFPELEAAVRALIEQRGADTFYVGSQGRFDAMAARALRGLQPAYPHVRWFVVLAYPPGTPGDAPPAGAQTLYPEGLETVPRRLAIVRRNRWMIQHCQAVVAYVARPFGGAAQSVEAARKTGREIIGLQPQARKEL